MLLNELPGWTFIGEMDGLWDIGSKRPATADCGCGETVLECPYWSHVYYQSLLAGENKPYSRELLLATLRQLNERIIFNLQSHGRKNSPPAAQDADSEAAMSLARILSRAASEADSSVIVHSSKDILVSRLLACAPDLEHYYVVLTRDPRGVVNSRIRSAYRRREAGRHPNSFALFSRKLLVWREARYWNIENRELIGRFPSANTSSTVYIKYEALAANPNESTRMITQVVTGSDAAPPIDFAGFVPAPNHIIKGNRIRKTSETVSVRPDTSFMRELRFLEPTIVSYLTRKTRTVLGYGN